MKPEGSATTFHVSNLDVSLTYYTAVLGFTQRFRFGDYAGVEHGAVQFPLCYPWFPSVHTFFSFCLSVLPAQSTSKQTYTKQNGS